MRTLQASKLALLFAAAAIRGTDWELEVAPDDRTTLVVLSGSVDFFNAQGTLTVARNEAAVAEVGKAPVRALPPDIALRPVAAVTIKGRAHSVQVYTLADG